MKNIFQREFEERNFLVWRTLQIIFTTFDDHGFPFMFDDVLLSLFRFCRDDIIRVIEVMSWPLNRKRTKRNRYTHFSSRDYRVQSLGLDQERKFVKGEVASFFRQQSIHLKSSPSYALESNGTAKKIFQEQ